MGYSSTSDFITRWKKCHYELYNQTSLGQAQQGANKVLDLVDYSLGKYVDMYRDDTKEIANATGAAVVSKVLRGVVNLPDEFSNFAFDPKLENLPILGGVGKGLGITIAKVVEDPGNFDNWLQAQASVGQAFLLVAPFVPKGPRIGVGTAGVTAEEASAASRLNASASQIAGDNVQKVATEQAIAEKSTYLTKERTGPQATVTQELPLKGEMKPGDVMTYKEYLETRTPGSNLRGHHTPQQARLKELKIDPKEGTVVVMEDAPHAATRTFKGKGRITAAAEKGKPLKVSEALDIEDLPVKQLGQDVAEKIQELNRKNHPEVF